MQLYNLVQRLIHHRFDICRGNIVISNPAYLKGRFIASGNVIGSNIISSAVTFHSLGKINLNHISGDENMSSPLIASNGIFTLSPSAIVNDIGSSPNFLGSTLIT